MNSFYIIRDSWSDVNIFLRVGNGGAYGAVGIAVGIAVGSGAPFNLLKSPVWIKQL